MYRHTTMILIPMGNFEFWSGQVASTPTPAYSFGVTSEVNLAVKAVDRKPVLKASKSFNFMERETRIELATNSLEGCDSTIELLPLDKNSLPYCR